MNLMQSVIHCSLLLVLLVPFLPGGYLLNLNVENNVESLPKTIYPKNYKLSFEIDVEESEYKLYETVLLDVIVPTSNITFNSFGLNIDWQNVSLTRDQHSVELSSFVANDDSEIVVLTFPEVLIGEVALKLSINQPFSSRGLFVEPKQSSLNTRFSQNFTRAIFPCWDEPEFKATFSVDIKHGATFTALSNMPKIASSSENHTTFMTTNRMSPGSFAFALSTQKNYTENGWSGQYANDALKNFENWMDDSYPLPKLDFLSVADLPAMSFNTWGLIRIRQPYLPKNGSTLDVSIDREYKGVGLISGGITSGWFLGKTTPRSYRHKWLYEGLNKYAEYLLTSQTMSQWRNMDQFLVREMQASMADIDSSFLKNVNQSSASRIASIIRMIHACLGPNIFQKGLQNYVKRNAYSTVTSRDFFSSLQSEVNKAGVILPRTVQEIFQPWIDSTDYPIIQVNRDYAKQLISLESNDAIGLQIPITISTASEPNFNKTSPEFWLKSTQEILAQISSDDWILVNNKATGYYRVNYDTKNWQLLIEQLQSPKFTQIHPLNRAQLLDDAYYFTKIGRLSYNELFELLSYLKREDDFIVWSTARKVLRDFERSLRCSSIHGNFEGFILSLVGDKYAKYSINERSEVGHIYRLNRLNIADLACISKHPQCVDEVDAIIEPFLTQTQTLPEELQQIAACTASRYLVKMTIRTEKLIAKFIMRTLPSNVRPENDVAERLVNGFGCASDPRLIRKCLDLSIMNPPPAMKIEIKRADRDLFLKAIVSGSCVGTKAALDFLQVKFLLVRQRYDYVPDIFDTIGMHITTDEQLDLLKKVNATHYRRFTSEMHGAMARAIEQGGSNIHWFKTNEGEISKWLSSFERISDISEDSSEEDADVVERESKDPNSAAITSSNVLLITILAVIYLWQ